MKSFLARQWFLLALVGGIAVATVFHAALEEWVAFLPEQYVVAGALFLMAVGLEARSLGRAVSRPWPALWAVLISYAVLPPLAAAVGLLMPGREDYRIGLLIIASVPCTLASAIVWTRRAGGNDAVALLVVVLTTCTGWFIAPLWLTVFGSAQQVAVPTEDMMAKLLLVLILPVALGQLARILPPVARVAGQHKKLLGVVSQLLILSVIVKGAVVASGRLSSESSALEPVAIAVAALCCLATHLGALLLGLGGARAFGFDRPSQIAVAFACSQKTLPVAIFLFDHYFKETHHLALVPIVFYHVGQLVVDTFIADRFAHHKEAPQTAPRHSRS
jgi:solute carrier family 10 (sodium/bile acid cotransporter), member 7